MITLLQSLQQWHYEILISTTTTTNTIANNIATTFTTSSTCNSTANISKRRSSSESKRSSEETTIMNAPAPAPAPATTPMNLEEARQALPLLCSTCSATKNWNLIMDLFQKWPNLLLQVLDIPLPALAKAAETAEQKKEQAASSKSTASTATSASCYPLTLLVAHQAPLHIIQSLCCAIRQHLLHSQNQLQLQPNKLKPNIYQEEYQSYDLQITQALQVACSVQVACSSSSLVEATIVYLTQQCPQAVQHTDSNGNLPLHNVTNNQFQHATLPTMQALIEPFPESILLLPSNNSNNKGTTPLQNIIHYGYDLNIVQYVVDQLQGQGHVSADTHTHKQNRNLHFNFGFHPFNHKRAVALSLLLPKLQSLTCYPSKWTWEGLCTLLQAIQQQHQQNNNTSITQLHLKGVPRNFFTANLRIQNALQECLYHNQETLQHLTIQVQNSWYDKNRQSDKQFLQDIANLMMKNQNYHCTKMEWHLQGLQFYKSDLEALLLLHSKPYGIHLEDCSLFDDNTTTITTTASCTTQRRNNNKYKSQCSLQRFALQNTRLSQSCFQGILQTILQQVPTLQYLCLSAPQDRLGQGVDDTDGINLTPFLKKVLMVDRNNHNCDIHNNCDDHQNVLQQHPSPPKQQQRTPLQTLKLEGLYVEPRFLVQYLQTTQKSQTNTTTVPYIEYRYHGHLWTSVQYCSALRHFGQYTCQSLRSSRLQLIQHLTELEEYDEMDTEYKTVVRYGLLVESPGLWASTSE